MLEIATKRFASKEKNKSTAITDSWAVKLERMNPQQRILCEKFVDDIMFEGQMGTLHRNSVKINTDNIILTPSTTATFKSNSSTPVQYTSDLTNVSFSESDMSQSQSQISNFFASFTDG